ncbi:YkvA family protein [Geomonas paludis]|uniref:DUF1232 domain-containing protein n=1 Tax=Geomonas paludis TaxID=2740185 RepID=A0A6V8MQK3_9BACT|nr:DUF1232 domain-containing protein [Geomonas paludis]GFO62330.1 hypothetical protein GMPD_02490 [Geomonas paludis]
MSTDRFANFRRHYSDSAMHRKMGKLTDSLREAVIILLLLLRDPDTPPMVKLLIVGVLGYVIFPFDLLPDPMPFGFTDDFAAVTSVLLSLRQHISEGLRQQAKRWRPKVSVQGERP